MKRVQKKEVIFFNYNLYFFYSFFLDSCKKYSPFKLLSKYIYVVLNTDIYKLITFYWMEKKYEI